MNKNMETNYKKIIPLRFQDAEYSDVPQEMRDVITPQIQNRNGIYLYGPAGSGKTHKVCGLAKHLLSQGINVKFFNTGDFLEKLREEFSKYTDDENYVSLFREVMDFKGVLIFDDIGAEKVSDWTTERLYLIINKKYEDMLPVIFTSNCDIEILSARLGDRIASRVAGMTIKLEVESEDMRIK